MVNWLYEYELRRFFANAVVMGGAVSRVSLRVLAAFAGNVRYSAPYRAAAARSRRNIRLVWRSRLVSVVIRIRLVAGQTPVSGDGSACGCGVLMIVGR